MTPACGPYRDDMVAPLHSRSLKDGPTMTLCPIAIAVTCRKCPIVSVCPVKTAIGDYVERKAANPATVKTKKK
jgi:hypothetical protein